MKTIKIYYIMLSAGFLALASCGTTGQTGRTTDAVDLSPDSGQQTYTATDSYDEAIPDSEDGNRYVVYQDGNESYSDYKEGYGDGYSDGYYSRRINMFDRPGGLFSYNYYMMNRPFYGGSYLWNSFAYPGFGWYGNPYMWSPGLSISMGFGSPFAYGGWYSPFRYGYLPYYTHYYPGYGYGGGYYGGKYITGPTRTANSYQPRRSIGSPAARAARNNSGNSSRTSTKTEAPRRVFGSSSSERTNAENNSNARRNSNSARRRVFKSSDNERTTTIKRRSSNTRTRSSSTDRNARRIRPSTNRSNSNTRSYQQPRRTISRPSTNTRMRSSSSPSISRPSTSTRTSSPRVSSPRRR